MARKIALLIGSSDYVDSRLSKLKGPALDVEGFGKVLKDPRIGAFDQVDVLVNEPLDAVRRKVFDLFDGREREDLALLYISGHGVLDLQGRLFFAMSNTEFDRLPITALRASEVQEDMNESRSRRQVLILDCCHSGAFYEGARHGPQSALTQQTFDVRGYGREVLAASAATQYAFEGDEFVEGGTPRGLGTFTHYLIEGLETGAAAPESEQISVSVLFDYAASRVKDANASMTPQRWSDFRDDQPLFIASNPHPLPMTKSISEDIRERLRSEDYVTRLGAVTEVYRQASRDAGLAHAAVVELQDIRAEERDVGVCEAIDQYLPALRQMIENQVTDSGSDDETLASEPKADGARPVEPAEIEPTGESTATRIVESFGRFRVTAVAVAVLVSIAASTLWFAVPRDGEAETWRDCEECPWMVSLPGGTFTMGSPEGKGGSDEGPQHEVTVSAFAIGKYEVTFAEWDACVADGGCTHNPGNEDWGRGNRPVINVSWDNTQEYVAWLNEKTGEPYRLPTEAEWEYAARAGTTTRYAFGDEITSNQANFGDNERKTTEVGSYPVNAWGLHDMHGNVWEWVEDCWDKTYDGAPTDGSAWLQGDCSLRVRRSGSWFSGPVYLRSADRGRNPPDYRSEYSGFRVARMLTP